jgi:maltooligosyltrehalose trehalohydrolase
VMPIAEFPGEFGWGYDGVDLFAPTRAYGTPDDFRRFVDSAHAQGLGVILDVVYNHLGPDGNYLKEFSDHYFTKKHCNDWGESLNFDDVGAAGVRAYFVSNARHWISEYHLDGFRFDATQAILDDSPEHILAEISKAARAAAGDRSIYLITENEPQLARIARPVDRGGYGMDALWNDDFHHSAMVALTGRNEAYFTDYLGGPQEFISACKWGYLFQGQFSAWQMKQRGTSALDLQPSAFVNYIQNHDQIANFGHGERAHQLSGLAQFKAMTVLLLLAPQTPLLFQGQEFAASSPFQYFADHTGDLPELIRKGRLKEFCQFPSNSHPEMQAEMRDPSDRKTFECCKLDWSQRSKRWHASIYEMHRQLLTLRREDPVFNRQNCRQELDGAVIGPHAFALRFFCDQGDRLLLINLGSDLHLRVIPEPLLAAPDGMRWDIILSTESPQFGGSGVAPLEVRGQDWRLPGVNLELPGRCALVLKPISLTTAEKEEYEKLNQDREAQRRKGIAGN